MRPARTCSADLSRPGRVATDWHRPVDVSAVRDQVPGLVGGQVDTESAACRRRPTTPARASAVSTSIACSSNRTSCESLSQKQPQAAQPAHTCGKPPSFGIPKAGMPGGGRPNSDHR